MVKGKDRWHPAMVLDMPATRSYVIKTPQGQVHRRNRQNLRARNTNTENELDTNGDWLDDNTINEMEEKVHHIT